MFPLSWPGLQAIEFQGMELHVVAPELQYVLKEHPEFLNPDWQIREKECLQNMLLNKGIDVCSLHKPVVSI